MNTSDTAPALAMVNPNADIELQENGILVLELDMFHGASDEEKTLGITNWVKAKQVKTQDQNGQPSREAPCIIVLGSSALAYAQMRQLAEVGAIFLVQPPEYANARSQEEKRHCLMQWLGDLELATSSETVPPATPDQVNADVSLYEDPPYKLSEEDFRRLLDRLNMSDEDQQKDD